MLVAAGLEAEMTAAGLPLHPRALGLECLEVGTFGLDLGPQGDDLGMEAVEFVPFPPDRGGKPTSRAKGAPGRGRDWTD